MSQSQTFVIVGAGLAGAKAAETLRDEGFDGLVVLVGEEPSRPYERPPLSKEYLRGEKGFDHAAVHDADFYASHGIQLRSSTVATGLAPAEHQVVLSSGERLAYDRLLLATGAAPRRLRVPGAGLDGVHYLRTLAEADSLHRALEGRPQVVVIGAGWIGTEVAASARQLGAEVTMVDTASVPLEGALGPRVGAVFRDLHSSHGVALRLGTGVDSLLGTQAVEGVRLDDGTVLPAQVVVVGVGATPRVELALEAGLRVDDGIVVDEHLATSDPDVYAAGDAARAYHPRYGVPVRLEHWSAALNQGPVAARNMLGATEAYGRTPYFFSDQYDLGMEYRGWAQGYDQVVLRGRPDQGAFLAFWLRGGRVVAAMNANVWDQGDAIEALLVSGHPVSPTLLADAGTDLASL